MNVLLRAGLAVSLAVLGTSVAIAQPSGAANPIDGRWDASLDNHGTVIPFRLDISGSGATLKGTFYNGFTPYDGTTSASFKDGKLVLNIEHYLTTITATLQDGKLEGGVATQSRAATANYGFHAVRHVDAADASTDVPNIAGSWEIPLPTPSSKGEKAYHLIVQQRGYRGGSIDLTRRWRHRCL